jgi:hypothetical protein
MEGWKLAVSRAKPTDKTHAKGFSIVTALQSDFSIASVFSRTRIYLPSKSKHALVVVDLLVCCTRTRCIEYRTQQLLLLLPSSMAFMDLNASLLQTLDQSWLLTWRLCKPEVSRFHRQLGVRSRTLSDLSGFFSDDSSLISKKIPLRSLRLRLPNASWEYFLDDSFVVK